MRFSVPPARPPRLSVGNMIFSAAACEASFAMTPPTLARPGNSPEATTHWAQNISRLCRQVAQGREAARTLDRWVGPLGLSETEFRLLWTLLLRAGAQLGGDAPHETSDPSLDQTQLAAQLAASPAQVSASVVRLQGQGWVLGGRPQTNRRRQVWQLTDDGRQLLDLTLRRLAADALLASQPTLSLEEAA